ncbi:MAG TPA: serine/threonine-protein kinase [Gaiella sp.]|nr:serine/threonine-protein kinase [Gaiella sp.]
MTRPVLPSRYAMPELIAHGGMGEVYRATDETLGRVVAVKVLSERYTRDDEFRARFLREAQTAASLSGEPNVIAIYDVDENEDDLPFIVMEYVAGGTVADQLRAGRVGRDDAMRWLRQAASALDRAHSRGIVHRDVKPANLLLADDGTIRVTDFGIARAAGHDTLTAAGTVLGSSGYMAPEQVRGERCTPASDRYALACVAFELLTGHRPFERANPTAEAAAHASQTPPAPSEIDSTLPPALDAVFARGLAKRPEDRHPSCAALVRDLHDALSDATAATTVAPPVTQGAPRVTRHLTRPRRTPVAVVALALLGIGAGLAWALNEVGGPETVVLTETVRGETVERTVTAEGETVERTVTADVDATPAPPPPPPQPPPPPPPASGSELNDQGFRLLQQGDVQGALPVLESAVAALSGSSTITEAYASYNLAAARFALGRCDGVAELLDRSEQVQGERKEIDRLRKQAEKRCEGD